MAKKKTYSAEFKFKVALEAIQSDNLAEIARKYGITGGLLSKWRATVLNQGHLAFGPTPEKEAADLKKKIGQLEQMIGQREVELKLLKNFSDFYTSQNMT